MDNQPGPPGASVDVMYKREVLKNPLRSASFFDDMGVNPIPWIPSCPIDVEGVCRTKTVHDFGPKMCRVVFPPQLSRG
jgi:hypothetical protein